MAVCAVKSLGQRDCTQRVILVVQCMQSLGVCGRESVTVHGGHSTCARARRVVLAGFEAYSLSELCMAVSGGCVRFNKCV